MKDIILETVYTAMAERIAISPYRYLSENSNEFQEIQKQNKELKNRFPSLSKILEHDTLEQESYSKEEIVALSNYLYNSQMLETLINKEAYKLGAHDAINILSKIHIIR